VAKDAVKLFTDNGVFTEKELHAHHEVMLENYVLRLDIESSTLEELYLNYVLPSAVSYQTRLAENVAALKAAGVREATFQKEAIKRIGDNMKKINALAKKMTTEKAKAHKAKSSRAAAIAMCKKVKPLMEQIRECCDDLELIIDDQEWSLAKYREIMFMK